LNLALFITFGVILFGAYANRLYGSLIIFLEVFFSSIITMLSFEYLSNALIKEYFPVAEDYANPVSFFLVFAAVLFIFHIVARAYFSSELALHKALNVIGSLVFGFLIWILVAGMLVMGFLMLPLEDDIFFKQNDRILFGVHKKFVYNFDKFCRQMGGGKWKYLSADDFIKEMTPETRSAQTVIIPVRRPVVEKRPEWPEGTGYLTKPRSRPPRPYRKKKARTNVEIIGLSEGQLLFSEKSLIEYRQAKKLIIYPGARITYLAESPPTIELQDFNGDVCTLKYGLTVVVDDHGQFKPVAYHPERKLEGEKGSATKPPATKPAPETPGEKTPAEKEEPEGTGTGHMEIKQY